MTQLPSLAILGGTFDPPHFGHLNIALRLQNLIHFDSFLFLPCKIPLLKETARASSTHRYRMLTLLLKEHPFFSISRKEIDRETPSYMVETLLELRKEQGGRISITLIIGQDAYQNIHQWYHALELPTLCNLLVVERPSHQGEIMQQSEPKNALFKKVYPHPSELKAHPHGGICFIEAGDYPISSTRIRNCIQAKKPIDRYVPDTIHRYIKQHHLYE